MRKTIVNALVFGLFFLILGFFNSYHLPQIKKWLRNQIALQSEHKLPFRILVDDISLSLLPFGFEVSGVQVRPKPEFTSQLAPIKIQRIVLGFHWIGMLTGSRNLVDLSLFDTHLTLIRKKTKNTSPDWQSNIEFPIERILKLPFHSVRFINALVRMKDEEAEFATSINGLDLDADFSGKSLSVQLRTSEFRFKKDDLSQKIKKIALEFNAIVDLNTLQIASMKVQRGDSVVVAAGFFEGDVTHLRFDKKSVKGRINVDLEELLKFSSDYIVGKDLPKITGLLDSSFKFEQISSESWSGKAEVRTKNLRIAKIMVGEVAADVDYANSSINVGQLSVSNSAGSVLGNKINVDLNELNSFSGNLEIRSLEVSELLVNFGLPRIPVVLFASGQLPCKGQIKPKPQLDCIGSLRGDKFRVFDEDKPSSTVVALKEFQLTGSVRADENGVYPKADIQIGRSKGFAEGEVLYRTGFNFSFRTPRLDFSDVENLADLKFEGQAEMSGQTQGDSDAATVNMEAKSRDLWFEDYAVGNMAATIRYRKGILSLDSVMGAFKSSQYQGALQLNLPQETIRAQVKAPILELNDLQWGFQRKFELPLSVYGSGSGELSVEGPLEFTALTYDLKTRFGQGYLGSEGFDSLDFNLHAVNGNVKTDRAELVKGGGRFFMEGQGYPTGKILVDVLGKGLRIEDFTTITDKGLGLTGDLNIAANLSGHVLKPNVKFSAQTSLVTMAQVPLQDSRVDIIVNDNTMEGKANFLGEKIALDFILPLANDQPFKFHLDTKQWDFAPLFSMISPFVKQQNYETELTSKITLNAERGGHRRASGSIVIEKLKVQRSALMFQNSDPLVARLRDGGIEIEKFLIKGDNTELKATSKSSRPGDSVISFGGNVDMSLLSFLTPFLQELRGILSLSSQIRFVGNNFFLQGSAFIDKGYAHSKDFPHTIEQLKADVLFSEKNIVINTANANFASGRLTADGQIRLEGYKKFPTVLNIRVENTTLKVPHGVSSKGSGEAKITGEWFPFLMTGKYTVESGLMDRQLGPEDQNTVRRSSYLPRELREDGFDPVEFNLEAQLAGVFKVKNALIDSDVSGSLNIRGTPSNTILLGEIKPERGGIVYFRETPFTIQSGAVKFDTLSEINPYIFGSATATVTSREYDSTPVTPGASGSAATKVQERSRSRDYDVTLLLQGRMKSVKIALTSQPPLEEYDIISLLALGVTSQQLEKRQSGDQATDLGSALLSQNLAIKNKLFDVKITSLSAAEDTNVGDSKVTLSRQWTPKMSTSVGRTFRTNVTDAKLKYDLSSGLAAILNWEGRQQSEETNQQVLKSSSDVLGIGLEYGVEFK